MANGYKDLRAWQLGMEIVGDAYALSSMLPKDETWSLVDQIRRAAVSIPSNIAEGTGRGSRLDFRRYLRMAMGSVFELETQILIVNRLKMASLEEVKPLLKKLDEQGKVLRGLIRSQTEQRNVAASHS